MSQQIIYINTAQIADVSDLHRLFAERLGFLEGYGMNWDAWIDCVGYLEQTEAGMTSVRLGPDDSLVLHFAPDGDLKQRLPQVWTTLLECAGFVNWRRVSAGKNAQLLLSFDS